MDRADWAWTVVAVMAVAYMLTFLFVLNPQNVERDCKKQYGQAYVGKSPLYGPDLCVAPDGTLKSPR